MEAPQSFVSVRHVGFEGPTKTGLLSRLTGRTSPGEPILKEISFSLQLGDWATLYGGPGAGKTTLLRLMTGVLKPTQGAIVVNGTEASEQRNLAAGYVSAEEAEDSPDTVGQTLHVFGTTHGISNLPSRLGMIIEALELTSMLNRPVTTLSTTERLRLNIARAALSDSPLVLFDDVAEYVGVEVLKKLLLRLFTHRSVLIATRSAQVTQALNLPTFLLHRGTLACSGTCTEMATRVAAPRVLDVWVEGIRYDLFRTIKKHPGVAQVLLIPDGRFHGQRLRITLKSGHYLPALYDVVSRVPLLRVEELPVSLEDILARL